MSAQSKCISTTSGELSCTWGGRTNDTGNGFSHHRDVLSNEATTSKLSARSIEAVPREDLNRLPVPPPNGFQSGAERCNPSSAMFRVGPQSK